MPVEEAMPPLVARFAACQSRSVVGRYIEGQGVVVLDLTTLADEQGELEARFVQPASLMLGRGAALSSCRGDCEGSHKDTASGHEASIGTGSSVKRRSR